MPRYLVLFTSGGADIGEPSEDEHKAWSVWKDSVGDAIVDFGGPTIPIPGGASGDLVGYSIVQAESLEALDEVFEANPHRRQGGTIEFHEIIVMPGD